MINAKGLKPINTDLTEISWEGAIALAMEVVHIMEVRMGHMLDAGSHRLITKDVATAIADKAGKKYDAMDECWKVRNAG